MFRWSRRSLCRRAAIFTVLVAALVLGPAYSASAHPLGNFTINHFNGLRVTPTTVLDDAVIDSAELPTISDRDAVDSDGDGDVTSVERAAYAVDRCGAYAEQLVLTVDGAVTPWTVVRTSYTYRPGAAGLETSRLECGLVARVDLTSPARITFDDGYLSQRIGWREITAVGQGVDLGERDVATQSISDKLRAYPNNLLTSPLDQRSVTFDAKPGADSGAAALPTVSGAGPFSAVLASVTSRLDGLVGGEHLTLGVGLLAVLLSLLLGASHAALPGHGKTLMAAYMVGTRGTPRDAVLIGATVTLAHTSGVLALGLLFNASASFAGETVLAALGVVSGLLVAGIGLALVRGAWRRHRVSRVDDLWGHGHGHSPGHGHGHSHGHGHDHGHDHGHPPTAGHADGPTVSDRTSESTTSATLVLAATRASAPDHSQLQDHPHQHHARREQGFRRMTLVGMGLAGGLVPSPSALIVLLGAIALGRTVFGVGLVLAYGIGMAATLTTIGYLVAKLPGRLHGLRRFSSRPWLAGLVTGGPLLTACLVLLVGLALAWRSAGPLI